MLSKMTRTEAVAKYREYRGWYVDAAKRVYDQDISDARFNDIVRSWMDMDGQYNGDWIEAAGDMVVTYLDSYVVRNSLHPYADYEREQADFRAGIIQ